MEKNKKAEEKEEMVEKVINKIHKTKKKNSKKSKKSKREKRGDEENLEVAVTLAGPTASVTRACAMAMVGAGYCKLNNRTRVDFAEDGELLLEYLSTLLGVPVPPAEGIDFKRTRYYRPKSAVGSSGSPSVQKNGEAKKDGKTTSPLMKKLKMGELVEDDAGAIAGGGCSHTTDAAAMVADLSDKKAAKAKRSEDRKERAKKVLAANEEKKAQEKKFAAAIPAILSKTTDKKTMESGGTANNSEFLMMDSVARDFPELTGKERAKIRAENRRLKEKALKEKFAKVREEEEKARTTQNIKKDAAAAILPIGLVSNKKTEQAVKNDENSSVPANDKILVVEEYSMDVESDGSGSSSLSTLSSASISSSTRSMLRDASQSQKKQDSDSGEEDEENTEDWAAIEKEEEEAAIREYIGDRMGSWKTIVENNAETRTVYSDSSDDSD